MGSSPGAFTSTVRSKGQRAMPRHVGWPALQSHRRALNGDDFGCPRPVELSRARGEGIVIASTPHMARCLVPDGLEYKMESGKGRSRQCKT